MATAAAALAAPKWAKALGGRVSSLSRAAQAAPVSRLGLGCAGIADLYRRVPETEAIEVVRYAHEEAGISLFDAAPFYG
jgi:aryl-alcohol dehydrogenase-like predicted oxidoreductase